MFAVEHYGIEPDIICLAKGIASGFPFAALGASAELMARWPKGSHGGTYGGNPLGARPRWPRSRSSPSPASSTTSRRGRAAHGRAAGAAGDDEGDRQVRGLGLMVGTELADATRARPSSATCSTRARSSR